MEWDSALRKGQGTAGTTGKIPVCLLVHGWTFLARGSQNGSGVKSEGWFLSKLRNSGKWRGKAWGIWARAREIRRQV